MKKQTDAAKSKRVKKVADQPAKVAIRKLPTGVRGLDEILGGGIPEFSFNVIAASPGCGKTTLAHQIVFANATVAKPALYFTVLGEPAIKMLRYQQQFTFFDESKLGSAIRFINLSDVVMEKDLDAVLAEIIKQVMASNPGIVVVDSFRTVMRKAVASHAEMEMQRFIQELTQFIAEGLRRRESGIIAIFEERPYGYTARAASLGIDLKSPQEKGKLEILYMRPLDLSVDETMQEILDAVQRTGATRLVIDSLVGFEMALAPGFREDFRESLYRMIVALTGAGVTIVSTVEVEDNFTSMPFSKYAISFLTDEMIRMRYVEIDGQLRKVMVVIKMRGGNHSKDIREYIITDQGLVVIGPRKTDYAALTTGIPLRIGHVEESPPEPKAKN
jgi:KaiC/GvpD/RAD55 family RecA-like ATPase